MWELFEKKTSIQKVGICLLLVVLIGTIDFLTGYELAFSIFYLVPIGIASWYIGRKHGLAISTLSALVWGFIDILSGHKYNHPAIPIWNTIVRLGFFITTTHLLSTLKIQFKIEERLAMIDSLTRTMNWHAFRETAIKLLGIAARHNRSTVLGYIDVDNFKKVNDTLGHTEGDKVLNTIGAAILNNVRTTDCVGRMGGDEFAILLPETSRSDATVVFERIQQQILNKAKKSNWPISVSIGVAVFPKTPPQKVEEAIKLADNLMYRVKNNGKNGILIEDFPDKEK